MNASAAVVDRDVAAPTLPRVPGIGIKRLAFTVPSGLLPRLWWLPAITG